MDELTLAAHLKEEIGTEAFKAIISPDNIEAVSQFAKNLVLKTLPKEMTIGGRTYEIIDLLKENETSINGYTMVERAEKTNANLGEEDGMHILKYQNEIPDSLRKEVTFVFPDWRKPDIFQAVFVGFFGKKWKENSHGLHAIDWDKTCRMLRRK
jgi:hypothetical protein